MKKWLVAGGVAAVCALFLGLIYQGFGRDPHEVPFMLKGKQAPDFKLTTLDGETVEMARLRGKPVVLNFWSSWCGPCAQEHSVLVWGARQYGAQAQFLGAVFEDTESNAREFLNAKGSGFPQLLDPRSAMAVDYAVAGVPETYFIDARGVIRDKYVGPLSPEALNQRMVALLKVD